MERSGKKTVSGYEVERSEYEYDDLAYCKEQGRSLYEVGRLQRKQMINTDNS